MSYDQETVYTSDTVVVLADGRSVMVGNTVAYRSSLQALAYQRIMQRAWRVVREMEKAS